MATSVTFAEDNGAATGSPATGTTRSGFGADTHYATEANWKNIDNCTENSGTAYSASPITAGNNSFEKFQYAHFQGTFSSVFGVLWAHTSGTPGTGLTINGNVSSTYTTPSTTANASLTTNMTTPIAIASGAAVLLSTTGPQGASPVSSISSYGYSQYLVTQLLTTTSASSGDMTSCVFTLSWSEN
jgi:hypothetical protein